MSAPLAITMGDASGIGPEIVLRRFCEGGLGDDGVVSGDASILRPGAAADRGSRAVDRCGAPARPTGCWLGRGAAGRRGAGDS